MSELREGKHATAIKKLVGIGFSGLILSFFIVLVFGVFTFVFPAAIHINLIGHIGLDDVFFIIVNIGLFVSLPSFILAEYLSRTNDSDRQ